MNASNRVLSNGVAALFVIAVSIAGASCGGAEREREAAKASDAAPAGEASPGATRDGAAPAGEVCAVHGAPKSLCFICDPALREPGRLWCQEHNRYEDRCWLCHPELRDESRMYCEEHGLYEDECFLCHPELRAGLGGAGSGAEPRAEELMCAEHGVPENECGICHPELAASLAPGGGVKVRLPAGDSADLVGVQTAFPEIGATGEGIHCLAELAFDENKLAEIVAPVGGIIRSVAVDLGARVGSGTLLAEVWSPEIAETAAQAVLSHQALERERKLRADGITSAAELEAAEAAHRAVCQRARTLGFSEDDIDRMGERPDEPVYVEVRAPFAGEIIERSAVRGERVEEGKPLFLLGDRASVWAMLSIPEAGLSGVRVGQSVELEVDALPGRSFVGELTWIAARVDDRTRMVAARAELANPDGILRDKMFARARIVTREAAEALLVPSAAVQEVEGRSLVFVKLADDLFEARAVYLGAEAGGRREVLLGLASGDEIAVERSFALKSQLLISRLGAGCVDE